MNTELISGGLCHTNKTIYELFLGCIIHNCDIDHVKNELISQASKVRKNIGGLCEFKEMSETIFYIGLEWNWEENPPRLVI